MERSGAGNITTRRDMSDQAKLGQVHDTPQGRDAVHIAIAPVIAAQRLWHFDVIGFLPGSTDQVVKATDAIPALGIVDPFLPAGIVIKPGERFFMFLYPQTITGLRHVWTHPAFPAEGAIAPPPATEDPVEASRRWIAQLAAKIDQTPNRLMDAAAKYANEDDYTYDNTEAYKDHWEAFPEFWKHWAVVTGKEIPKDASCPFTCSC